MSKTVNMADDTRIGIPLLGIRRSSQDVLDLIELAWERKEIKYDFEQCLTLILKHVDHIKAHAEFIKKNLEAIKP